MTKNTLNPFSNCGKSEANPKSPANPQYIITAFSHLPEKVEYQTPLGTFSYCVKHYDPIDEEVHTILEVIRQEKFKTQIDQLRLLYNQDKNQYSEKDDQFFCIAALNQYYLPVQQLYILILLLQPKEQIMNRLQFD